MNDVTKKKLEWRCRRGTRELDRMTQYYLKRCYDVAGAVRQRAFEEMLELPDPKLHDLLTGKVSSGDAVTDEIARLIRQGCGR